MCRNIRPLFNFQPPATELEIHHAGMQFVRKLSGFNVPSRANEAAFGRIFPGSSTRARSQRMPVQRNRMSRFVKPYRQCSLAIRPLNNVVSCCANGIVSRGQY